MGLAWMSRDREVLRKNPTHTSNNTIITNTMKLNKFLLTKILLKSKHDVLETTWVLPYHNLVGQYIIRISLFWYIGGLGYLLLECI